MYKLPSLLPSIKTAPTDNIFFNTLITFSVSNLLKKQKQKTNNARANNEVGC